MQIFSFLVLFVTVGYRSVLKPHISKTHLPINLMHVNLNWNDAQKTSQGKWEPPLRWGLESQLPPKNLKIY